MKITIIVILLLATGFFILSACRGCGRRGNGHVITEERAVTSFTKISITGVLPVELSQDGGKEWVRIQTDENLQKLISVVNDGDELIISTTKEASIRSSTKMKVYINIKKLTELNFSSVGSLKTAGNLKLDSLYINTESVGTLELDVNARFLHADLSSVGKTELKGEVDEVRINNKSVGGLSAFGLKAKTLMIHNTSVGVTEVYADSAFYIRSSSIGALYYKGPGELKELKSEGIGKVQKQE